MNPDDIFNQLKKIDPALSRTDFDTAYSNPSTQSQLLQVYEQYKPRSIVGQQITLPNGEVATVKSASEVKNKNFPRTSIVTDKGTFTAWDSGVLEGGTKESYNGLHYYPNKSVLDAVAKKNVVSLPKSLFTDLNKNPKGYGDSMVLVADPKAPTTVSGIKFGGLKLSQGEGGLFYSQPNGSGINYLYGDRAGLGNEGGSYTQKKSGGFLGKIGGAIGKVLDNPLVQLGVSAFVPGGAALVGGYSAGKIGGGLATGQLDFGDALKGAAAAGIGQLVGNLAKGATGSIGSSLGGGALGNIAGGAAQGAIRGGVGSLLSGGDLGQGLLSGGLFGAGTTAGGEIAGAARNALSTKPDIYSLTDGKTPGLGIKAPQAGDGLSLFAPPSEGLLGIDFGDPNNFGPSFDLPNGLLDFRPSVPQIGTIGDITIPRTIGFNPNVRNSDMGLDLTDKQTVPGQLGSGITFDVPGGTIGQGGFIPTGQTTLGNPNSFINGGTQGSSSGFDVSKLLKGLLGAGTAAAVGGGIANALQGSPQQQQTQQALPVQRFSMNPQTFNYTGDPAKYGETDIGNFQFYKPNIGLLG